MGTLETVAAVICAVVAVFGVFAAVKCVLAYRRWVAGMREYRRREGW